MGNVQTAKEVMSPHQAQILLRLVRLSVPAAPPLHPAALGEAPPLRIALSAYPPHPVLIGAALFFCLVAMSFVKVPLAWQAGGQRLAGQVVLESGRHQVLHLSAGRVNLLLAGPAYLRLGPASRRLLTGRIEADLRLSHGSMAADLAASVPREIFLHTPLLTLRVIGTRFVLSHHPDRGTELVLLEGKVQAWVGSQWVPLAEGQKWTLSPGGSLRREPLLGAMPPEALDLKLGGAEGQRDPDWDPELTPYLWYEELP